MTRGSERLSRLKGININPDADDLAEIAINSNYCKMVSNQNCNVELLK